jgi:uncharacterized protein (TIGR03382 family)
MDLGAADMSPTEDAGADAGEDAGADAGEDAGVDAGEDAGADAGEDAGRDAAAVDAAFVDASPPADGQVGDVGHGDGDATPADAGPETGDGGPTDTVFAAGGGCQCDQTQGPGALWPLLPLLALGARRRRARSA